MDITPDDAGEPPFANYLVEPYPNAGKWEWSTDDWDPCLRFWTLDFDPQLNEWLKAVDQPLKPSILAAREFATAHLAWGANGNIEQHLTNRKWLDKTTDLQWKDPVVLTATTAIVSEIEVLRQYMQDDRERYLPEIEAQADNMPAYILSFIGASRLRHPWTAELVNCALAITNIAYMRWKSYFKRVRPSFLCPGLMPPFGPPAHPAFPSGHSTVAHLIALFLLEIPQLRQRYGLFNKNITRPPTPQIGQPVDYTQANKNALDGTDVQPSPLLWLADRIAKNRERLGVHYPSDSSAGRHLAAGLAQAMLHPQANEAAIVCPTLNTVLRHAKVEWETTLP